MNCLLSKSTELVNLLDLPDELILLIMNKVKPHFLLFCSIIGTENKRLEQLALDKCDSIDLTSDYNESTYKLFTDRFYLHVMPRIYNNIRSLILNIRNVPRIVSFAKEYCNQRCRIFLMRPRAGGGEIF